MIEVSANLFIQPEHVVAVWNDPEIPGEYFVSTVDGMEHRIREPRVSILEFVLKVNYALGMFPDHGCRA